MRIHQDLLFLSGEDYARTLRDYVARVSQTPGVLAVFQFGEASHPGISDIDVLVSVHDDISRSALRALRSATDTDSVSRYLFAHDPVVVPQSIIPRVRYIHTLYHLRQVWGEPTEIHSPREEDGFYLRLAEYVDFTFAVRTVLRSMTKGDASLRWLLLLLKSCTDSLHLASSMTGRPLGTGIMDRVARLREESLRGHDGVLRSTAALVAECVEALREADRCLETSLQARGLIRSSPVRECICHADGRFYLFESPFGSHAVSADGQNPQPGGLWKMLGVDPSVETYPGFYLAQFANYGRGSGAYAAAHRLVFGDQAADFILDIEYRQLLATRLQIVQRMHGVISRGGLIPMVPLGIGIRAPDRIRPSKRRRLLRGIVARRAMSGGVR